MVKVRADQKLVEMGAAASLREAQALLMSGRVFLVDRAITKAGEQVPADAPLRVVVGPKFVSRSGEKLEAALSELGLSVKGLVCADIGSSTGGFTECLLLHGARRVYAVDVGRGLLANKLVTDARVTVMEGVNARNLDATDFPQPIDLATVDVSFIGMTQIAPALARILQPEKQLLTMIKPQFEAPAAEASKAKGVIRDPVVRTNAIESAIAALVREGFSPLGRADSRLPGDKGNVEHFVLFARVG